MRKEVREDTADWEVTKAMAEFEVDGQRKNEQSTPGQGAVMEEQKTYESNFSLWGKRGYVHGSHMIYQLFDAVKAWGLGAIDRMVASFRLELREQGTYLLFDGRTAKGGKEQFCATFKLYIRGDVYSVGLEGNGKALDEVFPDDEEELILNGQIEKGEKTASIKNFPADRFINIIIALNKKLNYETITSEGFGPWFMAQLDFRFKEIDISQSKDMMIRLVNNIGGKMTKSVIKIDGKKIGEIFFNRKTLS